MILTSDPIEIAWGTAMAAVCLVLAWYTLLWYLPGHAVHVFGRDVDPKRRLQLGWGLFAMGMAWTNVGCRFLAHGDLPAVHPGFAILTAAVAIVLGPRVVRNLLAKRHDRTAGRIAA